MIVIVFQAHPDGDFSIDYEHAGLAHEFDRQDYCGAFLCKNTDEAEETLLRLFESVDSSKAYIRAWFIRAFGNAMSVLRDEYALQMGWVERLTGNYEPTHLFMQTVGDSP